MTDFFLLPFISKMSMSMEAAAHYAGDRYVRQPAIDSPPKHRTAEGSTLLNSISHWQGPKAATFVTSQPLFLAYGVGISLVSPTLTGWQLCKVFSKPVPFGQLARLGIQILPHQTALKAIQVCQAKSGHASHCLHC